MPTFDKLPSFLNDWAALSTDQKILFMTAVAKMVADLKTGQGFRAGLRIKGVQGYPWIYEMTWSGDGRATFEYGTSPHQGDVHIIWRRVGTHDIFKQP
jgi:hypothetical protein